MANATPTESLTRVLLVDKPVAIEALRPLLGKEYTIFTASDIAAAETVMTTEDVDVLVTDCTLPDGRGLDLLAKARERFPDMLGLVFSRDEADLKALSVPLQQGVVHRLLTKPIRPSDFRSALRTAAELHRLRAERRDLRRKLEKSGRLRVQFLSLVGRELRTPVSYLEGLLELLRVAPDSGRLEERLERLNDRVQRLSQTVEAVMALVETDELTALPKPTAEVSLTALIAQTLDTVAPYVEARQQTLDSQVADDLGTMTGHTDLLAVAVGHLLKTAVLVSGAKASVKLQAQPGQLDGHPAVVLTVQDAGELIPEADRPYVFEPFYFSRTPTLITDGPEGRGGLHPGLAMVQRVANLHGGRLRLVESLPTGSTFELALPRSPAKP